MAGRMAARRRANRKWIVVTFAVVMLMTAMAFVGANTLKVKNSENLAEIKRLEVLIEQEKNRSEELEKYSEYTKSDDFYEWYAKEKMGLVYKNEIIFRGE